MNNHKSENKRTEKISVIILLVMLAVLSCTFISFASDDLTILFTHDIHDYLYPTSTMEDGELIEHGGAAKLATIIENEMEKCYAGSDGTQGDAGSDVAQSDNVIYLDGGDFSMGTLIQAAYSTDAFELRNLGLTGCTVTTLGNHEYDYGCSGLASMLRAAVASGDPLPEIVQANMDFNGSNGEALSEEQLDLKNALDEYGVKNNIIIEKAGYKIGIFGVAGYDSIDCTQADVQFRDYIEVAGEQVEELKAEGCDIIIALSHAGTDGDRANGEDIDLAEKVDGIDIIISGHTHTKYDEPVIVNDTVIVSCSEYLKYVGKLVVSKSVGNESTGEGTGKNTGKNTDKNTGKNTDKNTDGTVLKILDYELIPLDSSVPEDAETAARIETYKKKIEDTYLSGKFEKFDQVIAHSDYDLISLGEMYDTHQEYNTGDLIADAYLYEAEQNGIDDIDVALVGLGTIRGSIKKGDITVADAFEICSLGVGSDGTAGHPILSCYISGKELKLLTELDASLGELVSSIKMSYAGIQYTYNPERAILDRVTKVELVGSDGRHTYEIKDDKLYRVAANTYAANMLGMLNDLTKGALSITPKDADGNPVEDFTPYALKDENGNEIKEWVAFADYLSSFEVGESGYPEIPIEYSQAQGRKNSIAKTGFEDKYLHGGAAVKIIPIAQVAAGCLILVIIMIILLNTKANKKTKEFKKLIKGIKSISGTVVHGNGKGGKEFSVPTLNIIPDKPVDYKQGVYVSVTRIYGDYYYSVTNIGTNPTITDDGFEHKLRVETHLLDVDKELYNKTAEVWPIEFVREQKTFASTEELAAQIKKDIEYARGFINS